MRCRHDRWHYNQSNADWDQRKCLGCGIRQKRRTPCLKTDRWIKVPKGARYMTEIPA